MPPPPPESCRTVQGSRQDGFRIPSEQRTERAVGCAGQAPDIRQSSAGAIRNKSGTAEVMRLCLLLQETKALFLCLLLEEKVARQRRDG